MRTFSDSKLQEAYERGFQNGFSMALDEKDSDTFNTNSTRYLQAIDALNAYCAAFLVFRNEPEIHAFLYKVHKEFYAEWSKKSFNQILADLDNKTYTGDIHIANNERAAYHEATLDLIGDLFYVNDGSNDWPDRTLGSIRKFTNEANKLAKNLGLSHQEIAKFYKDTKTPISNRRF